MLFLRGALILLPAVLAAPLAIPSAVEDDDCDADYPETTSSVVPLSSPVASSSAIATSSVAATSSSISTAVAAVTAPSTPSVVVSATSASVSATASPTASTNSSSAGLNSLGVAAGLTYFGSATDNSELTDSPYLAILNDKNQFGQITPGNSQKWDATEPHQGTFTFTNGDAIVNLAKANNQKVRCHNLVWYSQLPSWVTSGTWTNETLTAVMKNHITTLIDHYGSSCYAWDVVNEPFNEDGTYRTNVFYENIGEEYIPIAFETAAAAAAPYGIKLYLNEYNIESAGAKATAAQRVISQLKARNIQIDGVGLQSHFIVGETASSSTQATNMAAFAALGVDVAITELDIRMTMPSTSSLLAQQRTDYESTVSACVQTNGCVGITIWDYTDKYSWVPNTFSGQGAACPWDANLAEKPAHAGIVSALSS